MKIERFEDIQAWQEARALCRGLFEVCARPPFCTCFALRDQIDRASGSVMDNIAEGFDAGSTAEFVRFLGYAQRSCSEVKSQLYRACDRRFITPEEFETLSTRTATAHALIGGFIRYLKRSKALSTKNQELRTKNQAPSTTN